MGKSNFEKAKEVSDRLAIEPRTKSENEVTRNTPQWMKNIWESGNYG